MGAPIIIYFIVKENIKELNKRSPVDNVGCHKGTYSKKRFYK